MTRRLPIAEAAQELGERPGTLRRWIREGCPVAVPGQRGRGYVMHLDPDEVREWRAAANDSHDTDDKGRAALLLELSEMVPVLIADATVEVLAAASPRTQGGGELRRLREALDAAAKLSIASIRDYLAGK